MDVAQMYDELDDHGFTDTGTARKLSMLNDALYDAAGREVWPHLETSINLTFSGSSPTASNFPANFKRVIDLIHVGTKSKIEWERLDVIDAQGYDLTQNGTPMLYYMIGNTVNFWPVPTASDVVRMRYNRIPAALTDSTLSAAVDWPVEHHRALVLGALYRLYDLEDDPELAQRFQQHYEQRLAFMAGDVFNRQTDRPDRIYMIPGFDYDLFE